MKILCDMKNRKLWLSRESYIEKDLERFNLSKGKAVCSPRAGHLKLSSKQYPTSEKDMKEMSKFPYAFAVDQTSLMRLELLAGFLLIMERSTGK